jgi:hypothetical protein
MKPWRIYQQGSNLADLISKESNRVRKEVWFRSTAVGRYLKQIKESNESSSPNNKKFLHSSPRSGEGVSKPNQHCPAALTRSATTRNPKQIANGCPSAAVFSSPATGKVLTTVARSSSLKTQLAEKNSTNGTPNGERKQVLMRHTSSVSTASRQDSFVHICHLHKIKLRFRPMLIKTGSKSEKPKWI